MHIKAVRVQNFRRLRDVKIDFEDDISILVGPNNSGKTSASQALDMFLKAVRDRFTIHDFNADSWPGFVACGERVADAVLPKISLDLWFGVGAADLHRVMDLLPSLAWQGTRVGVRVEFAPVDPAVLMQNFDEARAKARAHRAQEAQEGGNGYHPPPKDLKEYLEDHLKREYDFRYYILDEAQFDPELKELPGYSPLALTPDKGRTGKDILNSIIKVDLLHAQRHLSDTTDGSRSESLSKCLSRFYERNLEKRGDDYDALKALSESEALLNDHLQRVFEPTLSRVAALGYPGLANPRLLIKSALNPVSLMGEHKGAHVHYALNDPEAGVEPTTLPDKYNGLGFKNLIYMVVEMLDLHARWLDIEENRPPLHLIFVEEPEAHLHAQLQQVFIRKIVDLLEISPEDRPHYTSQLVVTTHSAHILYERGFRPIRYFRRVAGPTGHTSEVLNLSAFYEATKNPTRDFLERYLKVTHCDLFFADAAVLVEGNVERIIVPQMIAKAAPRLQSAYLSILEIGGAFGHRFRTLIEFLGITALIITDIDSVSGPVAVAAEAGIIVEVEAEAEAEGPVEDDDGGDEEPEEGAPGSACMVHIEGAITSNRTLIEWLPGITIITELLEAVPDRRTQARANPGEALIRVTYQTQIEVTWREETKLLAGRTLEEAFALENLAHCQTKSAEELKLRIPKNSQLTLDELAARIHKRVKGSSFKKTDFALALLAQDPKKWVVPTYIADGLKWLEASVVPPVPVAPAAPVAVEVGEAG